LNELIAEDNEVNFGMCVQRAGDVMIAPTDWGHLTYNLLTSVGLAKEFQPWIPDEKYKNLLEQESSTRILRKKKEIEATNKNKNKILQQQNKKKNKKNKSSSEL
jgi:oxalate decarboxylase/phosphoglucose isomerase-like protein (cupin superfamily)